MSDHELPNFIYAGPNKSGSTWTYNALREHANIFMANRDPVNYFDVHYHRGESWYRSRFEGYEDEVAIGDESPGYIKNPYAPKRINNDLDDVKIIFCLRNPINRAFSQWWHEEGLWTDTLSGDGFEWAVKHHPVNDVYITPGYYHYHLSRWEKHFSENQIKILFFDDFKNDNESHVQEIYDFIGVDDKFTPSVCGSTVNKANDVIEPMKLRKMRKNLKIRIANNAPKSLKNYILKPIHSRIEHYYTTAITPLSPENEYKKGMDPDIRRQLENIYKDDVIQLQKRTGRDLSYWFEFVEL